MKVLWVLSQGPSIHRANSKLDEVEQRLEAETARAAAEAARADAEASARAELERIVAELRARLGEA